MKQLSILLAMLLLLVAWPAFAESAEQSDMPFTALEVEELAEGLTTVGDFAALLGAEEFDWTTEEATGELILRMDLPGGSVNVSLFGTEDAPATLMGETEGYAESLSEEDLAKPAKLSGAEWMDASFDKLGTVRDIQLGDSREQVLSSFLRKDGLEEGVLYDISSLNPDADADWIADSQVFLGGEILPGEPYDPEMGDDVLNGYDEEIMYTYADVQQRVEWRNYTSISYLIKDGQVVDILLYTFSDSE